MADVAAGPQIAPETVAINREWIKHTISCLQGELPSGRIGDAIFLLRDILQDILDKPPQVTTEHPMNKVQPSCPCGTSEEECPNTDGNPLCAHPQADVLREALAGFADDYMTSDQHHPGYVLIPTAKFEKIRAALASEGKPDLLPMAQAERCPRCDSPDPARHPAMQPSFEHQIGPTDPDRTLRD